MIMLPRTETQLVFTVKDRCRVCYTCVRECPVKAIRIINGQAEVMNTRCIGCGNCVRVCSQEAKYYANSEQDVLSLLAEPRETIACLAPSFPAEFDDISDYRILVGMIKKLGFTRLVEVAYGADITAAIYKKLKRKKSGKHMISADCPAIVYYIRHYHPNLVPNLSPVASPMVATVRALKKMYGEHVKTVFIGPCVAKKAESSEVDLVITFRELRNLFALRGIQPGADLASAFDRPYSSKGAAYATARGKLFTMGQNDHEIGNNILVASGKENFREAIREFEHGLKKQQHLEVLCCNGCIMGAGMTKSGSQFTKMSHIHEYISHKIEDSLAIRDQVSEDLEQGELLDLRQEFTPSDRRIPLPSREEIDHVLTGMGKLSSRDHLNCGACGYDTCVDHAVAIVEGLAESEMCLPYTIEKLHRSIEELNISNEKLASAQLSLKHSEKLAHMGQLSAGIAHELNNPLGVITMYSNILKEEFPADSQTSKDLELIVEQADRCKKIVSGLLNFARKNQVRVAETNLVEFTRHSLDQVVVPPGIRTKFNFNIKNPVAFIDTDQMLQVLTNLEKNAFEAMIAGGTLTIGLEDEGDRITFTFTDTGCGIAEENMDKIFTPFFTTKQPGKGTGLGLPLIYGIVKMHKGQITVESNTDPKKGPLGTTFRITIPRNHNV